LGLVLDSEEVGWMDWMENPDFGMDLRICPEKRIDLWLCKRYGAEVPKF
jgi:hypothetical protein